MSQFQKYYLRFSVTQRIEHLLLVISFTILAVTGLPQKFVGYPVAEDMIAAMGGIEMVRIIHRYAAVILMIQTIYHGAVVTYKVAVQRVELTMMLEWQDLKDLLGVISYNLGLSRVRPKLPRYNFEEKMEYWAVVWGTVIMIITGFMLWNPIATAKFLPGSFIPAAKAAHGGEALLAVLAIIVWHMYGVHLRKFNQSMFTGKLSYEEMAHEHVLELEQIESGTLRPPAPPEEEAKRARLFIPVAVVISLVLFFGVYLFITFEETAIATIPAPTEGGESVFQPIEISANGGSLHATLQEYTGPESCAAAGCHNAGPIETTTTSTHSQRIAAAGPHPWLAKLAENGGASASDIAHNCLLCHAQDYQADDLLASAQSINPAGGKTCLRCHSNYADSNVHTEVGLTCVSCHISEYHQITTEAVTCTNCHPAMPHSDPFLNTKHERLDCRTCHVPNDTHMTVDASQPIQDPTTGFFGPTVESVPSSPQYAWQTGDGLSASPDSEGTVIVPVTSITLRTPEGFDPADFALSGQAVGPTQETTINIVTNHNITTENIRTCATCHGPDGDFDFASLGYAEEQADNLSARAVGTE